jgi:hypothetical protein
VVLDESRTSESLALVDQLRNTGNFDIVAYVADRKALDEEIRTGRAMAGVVIPPTFLTDLRRGRTAEAQVIVDAPPLQPRSLGKATCWAARTTPSASSPSRTN